MPLLLLSPGNIVSAPHKHVTGTVEINRRSYRDGKLPESWNCAEQVFQPPEYCSPCTASYNQYVPSGCYHVYYLGLQMLGGIATIRALASCGATLVILSILHSPYPNQVRP